MVKSMRVRWEGHVVYTYMGDKMNAYRVMVGKPKEREN
jgi:hypothetical protein